MHCEKAKSLLGWFYDDELDAPERELVAEHVERCPKCARELAGLRELDRISRQLVAPEPPASSWEQIAKRLPVAGAKAPAPNRLIGRRRFLLAAGVLAASVAGGTITYRLLRSQNARPGNGVRVILPQQDPVLANLALLSPEDRHLAESQAVCAAGDCNARLGAGGQPIKVVLQQQPVFLCCKECEQWARAHPAEAVAKVHTLEHRHDEPKNPN
jgi:hypothetical protein